MIYFSQSEIDAIISEDLPLFDLTSFVLDIRGGAKITLLPREEGILCGIDEVKSVFERFNIKILHNLEDGTMLKPDETIISGIGDAKDVHKAWRIGLNILEHTSGIATRTYNFIQKAKKHNKEITITTTRKSIPFTKKLMLKAIMTGGAMPHRISLSDTMLIFKEHVMFVGFEEILKNFKAFKKKSGGKSMGIEVSSKEGAKRCIEVGFDFVQLDKWSPEDVKEIVEYRDNLKSSCLIGIAGEVNTDNVEDYAKTGVDIIVTSSLYWGKPLDIKAVIEKT